MLTMKLIVMAIGHASFIPHNVKSALLLAASNPYNTRYSAIFAQTQIPRVLLSPFSSPENIPSHEDYSMIECGTNRS